MLRNRRGSRRWGGPDSDDTTGRTPRASMGPAVGLSVVATALAGAVAYGTHPAWAQFRHGLDVIMLSRQLQWPFIALSLIATIALLGTIIAGRRSAWWLIGLAPILALFGHRFATDPTGGMAAVENPTFVTPDLAGFVNDVDYVVGITFEGKNFAYPYAALYSTPAVIHAQHDKRVLVLWSAPANRALAYAVKRDVRARDLDVVSTPANALLVYDTARGIFVNGLTGLTPEGQKPPGFNNPVPIWKMTWAKWRSAHPDTLVMVPVGKLAAAAPRVPMRPVWPMPKVESKHAPDLKVVVVGTQHPAAVPSASLAAVNLSADAVPVIAFRDPETGAARGFRRRLEDLSPRFKLNKDAKRTGVVLVDSDTNSGWNAAGVAIDAKKEFRGKRLAAVPVEDELYWGVMKFWYPDLQLTNTDNGNAQTVIELTGAGNGGARKESADSDPADAGPKPAAKGNGGIVSVRARPGNSAAKKKSP